MKPITASDRVWAISSTPASRMPSPPTPTRRKGAPASRRARATPAPCRSPEASPVTNMISRTARDWRHWQRALDVGDDLERHGERLAPLLPGDGDGDLAADRRQEALELEAQRLPLLGLERNALHELLEREGRRREGLHVDVAAQPEELAVARREVERDVLALLEDADLPHALARHAARRDVGHRPRVEGEARVRHVHERREHGHPD